MTDGVGGVQLEGWSCPLPLRGQDRIVLGHGGGGKTTLAEAILHR